MRNHVRFQEKISICSTIQTVKGFIRMTGNSSRKHMRKDIVDFSCLKFFDSPCVVEKRHLLFRLFGILLMLTRWRSTLMVLLEGVRVWQHVQVFFMVAGVNI